jgi:hypothetical protein
MSNTKQRKDLAKAELDLSLHLNPTDDMMNDIPTLSAEDEAIVSEFYRMLDTTEVGSG